ncbi:hypothetical protein MNBD_GAMMA01-584 [hydrothermal vent metagenome]|uniref:Uncharacterized protein n=1 Tax=hydrothermal vent metagenome TaxID=652676 RepID=A0A3B0V6K7_9ZZZZ
MNTNEKIQESLELKEKALGLLAGAIAKLMLRFKLQRGKFHHLLDEKLVQEAKKQDTDANIVTLAIRTGIDRRYIKKYLDSEMPRARPDKLVTILEDVRWTAQRYYNSKTIPTRGPFRTFQSICEQRAPSTLTYTAILEELIKNGNLKDLGNNKLELLKLRNTTVKDDIKYSQISANQINRTVDTIVFNASTDLLEDKLVQQTIFSTQINPTNFDELHKDIKLITKEYRSRMADLMISYEENVNVGTYPEYGFSFLEYKFLEHKTKFSKYKTEE